MSIPHLVVVGGGAGGLELVTRLGHALGKKRKARITLVDNTPSHLWKPLLHEVAAGTLLSHEDELNYLVHARSHYYEFQLGKLLGLNRANKCIQLAAVFNNDGEEITPARNINYDILIIAVGCITNDFATPGAGEYCFFLDNRDQAERFQQHLLTQLFRAQYQVESAASGQLDIAIIGGGATGVELAAELHHTIQQAVVYGLEKIKPEQNLHITIIEVADRILAMLPKRISIATEKALNKLDVQILTNEKVNKITAEGLETASGKFIPAALKVWAAGIKAPEFLRNLDGLVVNKINQLIVKANLQTTVDEFIFALGDCASCPQKNTDKPVPPRAQAAHQQASLLAKSLARYLRGKTLLDYQYRDYGSLISLSKYDAVGTLMGRISSVVIEGKIARLVYLSLYKMHQSVLYGYWRVLLLTIANFLTHRVRPRLKLH